MTRLRLDGQPYARNYWHEHLMDNYGSAAHAWWRHCEASTSLYPTEVIDYKADHPHPLLRDFMIQLSRSGGWHITRSALARREAKARQQTQQQTLKRAALA